MRKILLLLLFIPFFAIGQDTTGISRLPVDPITKLITFKRTFEINNLSKDALFAKIKEWVIFNYRAQSAPIQFEDLAAGKILAKGQKSVIMVINAGLAGNIPTPSTISYVLTFKVIDNQFNVVLDSFANNYNGNALPIEQAFLIFDSVKKSKQAIKTANDMADKINQLAKSTLTDIETSIR